MSPDIDARPALPATSTTTAASRSKWPLMALGVTAAALLAALPVVFSHLRETPAAASTVRFSVPPPNGVLFHPDAAFPALSPDGQHLIYRVVSPNTPSRLWLYAVSTQSARELPGTDR